MLRNIWFQNIYVMDSIEEQRRKKKQKIYTHELGISVEIQSQNKANDKNDDGFECRRNSIA